MCLSRTGTLTALYQKFKIKNSRDHNLRFSWLAMESHRLVLTIISLRKVWLGMMWRRMILKNIEAMLTILKTIHRSENSLIPHPVRTSYFPTNLSTYNFSTLINLSHQLKNLKHLPLIAEILKMRRESSKNKYWCLINRLKGWRPTLKTIILHKLKIIQARK
jgi:hypothetical protein